MRLPPPFPLFHRSVPLCLLCVLCVLCGESFAADWIDWRGPEQTGVSPERDLPEKWSPDPNAADSNLIWKAPYGCRSTPLIMNGRLFFIGDVGHGPTQQERVVCLDADTGKKIWEYDFNVWQTAIVANRLGWTNLTGDPETGNVYAYGTQGLLLCFNRDGKIVWQHSMTEEYGRVSGYGGRNASPLVDGDLVLLGLVQASWGDLGRGMSRFVAFNKKDGHVVWWSSPCTLLKGTYYSNPIVAVINGQRLLISGAADGGLHALKVRTGEPVWSYLFGAAAINASPVASSDGKVYCSHGEESPDSSGVQGRIICVDATKITEGKPALVWKVDGIKAGYTSPILDEANNRLYVADDGAGLFCFDAKTGAKNWKRPHKYGRLARGSPLLADGKIYVAEVNSKFHILKPGATKCEDLHEHFFPSPDGTGFVEINSTPAAVNGKVYFSTRDEFLCIGKKDHKTPPDKLMALPKEPAADPKATVAAILVEPADVVLQPGHSQTFTVRGYDKDGRFIKEIKDAAWSLPTPPLPPKATKGPPPLAGEIKDGKLTVAKERPVQGAYVEAAVGKLTARARVRVVQALPMKFDFSKVPEGGVPSGWISAPGKYAVVKMTDGTVALKKLADKASPPLSRVFTYCGLPSMTDYTIQADILGKEVRGFMPEPGIVANRYTLLLDGKKDRADNKRRLRIVSWEALPRVDKAVVFDWQPEVWYRLKLTVDVVKDKAHVRGKAWKASVKEPAEWTVEFEDALPNREGAPALFGYATGVLDEAPGSESYFNNVSVTPNKKVEAAK